MHVAENLNYEQNGGRGDEDAGTSTVGAAHLPQSGGRAGERERVASEMRYLDERPRETPRA